MGWLKVIVKQRGYAEPTVISTDKIVGYNTIPDRFAKHDDAWLKDSVAVATVNTHDGADVLVSCPSLDIFTGWVRRAEQDGYFDATVKLDPDSTPE